MVSQEHLDSELHRIEALGGEGIILRRRGAPYTPVVIAHLPGKGRNAGRMGALLVVLPDRNIKFKIGTGFSDAVREDPPPIGSLVTFKYYGFYASGMPRFPSFLRIRENF